MCRGDGDGGRLGFCFKWAFASFLKARYKEEPPRRGAETHVRWISSSVVAQTPETATSKNTLAEVTEGFASEKEAGGGDDMHDPGVSSTFDQSGTPPSHRFYDAEEARACIEY